MDWWDVGAALVFGSACAGCGAAGRPWCARCRDDLEAAAEPHLLDREVPTVAVCPYTAGMSAAVVGFKDRGIMALAPVLGDLLALGVTELAERVGFSGSEVLLVPVPSAPAAVRRRGLDHTWTLARRAASTLDLSAARLLRSRRRRDQTGLASAARRRNLAGRIRVSTAGDATVVVLDDLTTTGATLHECDRALRAGGYAVAGHVVLAAAGQ